MIKEFVSNRPLRTIIIFVVGVARLCERTEIFKPEGKPRDKTRSVIKASPHLVLGVPIKGVDTPLKAMYILTKIFECV